MSLGLWWSVLSKAQKRVANSYLWLTKEFPRVKRSLGPRRWLSPCLASEIDVLGSVPSTICPLFPVLLGMASMLTIAISIKFGSEGFAIVSFGNTELSPSSFAPSGSEVSLGYCWSSGSLSLPVHSCSGWPLGRTGPPRFQMLWGLAVHRWRKRSRFSYLGRGGPRWWPPWWSLPLFCGERR